MTSQRARAALVLLAPAYLASMLVTARASAQTTDSSGAQATASSDANDARASSDPHATTPARRPDDDGGRKALLWFEAGGGLGYVNLGAINYDNLYPSFVTRSGTGPTATAAFQIRPAFLLFGVRGTLSSFSGFDVGTVAVEVGIRPPTPFLQPYLRAGVGYGWIGAVNYHQPGLSQTSVYGFVVQTGLGVDMLLGRLLSLGIGLDVDFLNLSRQPIKDLPATATDVSLMMNGDAVGVQVRAHLHLGLRF